jgi:hypothetical protein
LEAIMHDRRLLTLVLLFAVGACSADHGRDLGSWVAEWDTIGDTVVVRTVSGSVWGGPVEMVEELSIGVLEGADELMFGSIQAIAVDEAGGIYAFDSQVPALRYFDVSGNYVRTLGGEGGGPGEYGEIVGGLTVRRDGKVVLADFRNTRLNLYEPDGTLAAHWPVQGGVFSRQGVVVDTANHSYVSILTEAPQSNAPMPVGYLHLDPEGNAIDTLLIPELPGEPETRRLLRPMDPSKQHALSPLGYMVVGVNDDYSFDVRWPAGRTVRIERAYEPVAFTPEERAEWDATFEWFKGIGYPVEIGSLPDRKLPYAYFLADERGRVWVRRAVEARKDELVEPASEESSQPPPFTWVEPEVYDVFEPDGTYLGEVRFPWRTRPLFVRGDTAWGVRRGELDEQYIVRLLIAPAAPDTTG